MPPLGSHSPTPQFMLFPVGITPPLDEHGRFQINLPQVDGVGISIRYLGYQTKFQQASQNDLTIQLHPDIQHIKNVTVIGKKTPLSLSSEKGYMNFDAKLIGGLSAFAGGRDLFKSIQMLPGIAAYDDFSAQLSVRGSNGDENMVILDGITLYNVTALFWGL